MTDVSLQNALSRLNTSLYSLSETSGAAKTNTEITTGSDTNVVISEDGTTTTATSGTSSTSTLTSTASALASKYSSTRTSSTSGVLFDIYTIMNLIQEMSQKLRDAMREMRQLEMTTIQANIMSQAEQQRAAAMTQLITGIATFAIQAGVALGGMAKQLTALNQESTAKATQGVDVAKAQADIARLGDSPTAIETKIDSIKTSTAGTPSQQAITELNAKFDGADIKGTRDQVVAKVETDQAKLQTLSKEQATVECDAAAAKVDAAKANYEMAKATGDFAQEAAAKGEYQQANKAYQTALDNKSKGVCTTKTPEMQQLEGQIKANQELQGNLERSGNYSPTAQSYDDIATQCQAEYDKTLAEANAERGANGKVSAETQEKLSVAGDKLTYARARQIQHLQKTGGSAKINQISNELSKSLSNKLEEAGIDSNKTSKAVLYGTLAMNISQMIGQLGQSIGNTVSEYQKAKATEMSACEKGAEEQLNQLKDMYDEMLTTINKAISLYEAVTQKESQTVEEISGAIRG